MKTTRNIFNNPSYWVIFWNQSPSLTFSMNSKVQSIFHFWYLKKMIVAKWQIQSDIYTKWLIALFRINQALERQRDNILPILFKGTKLLTTIKNYTKTLQSSMQLPRKKNWCQKVKERKRSLANKLISWWRKLTRMKAWRRRR